MRVAVVVGMMSLCLTVAAHPAPTPSPASAPIAALGDVQAVGITDGAPSVYVSTSSGLYRSASPTLTIWTKQAAITDILAVSPAPHNAADVLYTRAAYPGYNMGALYRSTDGGRTARRVTSCGYTYFARSPRTPRLVYGASQFVDNCVAAFEAAVTASIARSTDDGLTWTTVYTTVNSYDRNWGIGPVAIAPRAPGRIVAAVSGAHGYGDVVASVTGGRTWTVVQPFAQPNTFPLDVAVSLRDPRTLWSLWNDDTGLYRSVDGKSWQGVPLTGAPSSASPDALALDPATGRAYVAVRLVGTTVPSSHRERTAIYALDGRGHVDRFAPSLDVPGNHLALTRGGAILTWYDTYAAGPGRTPLAVHPLIAAGNWAISAIFSADAARRAARPLGQPISPTSVCSGSPCQYFTEGALEQRGQDSYAGAPLVTPLMAARAALPIGGATSTVTYGTLRRLRGRRAPPPGFRQGTSAVAGGTFVPDSPHLTAAPGYVVPTYFWRYITDRHNAPDGWLRDIGLPLTRAVTATVTTGTVGTRTVVIQAFQNAILTDDPTHAAPWRVGRATIGSDYARVFPRAVR